MIEGAENLDVETKNRLLRYYAFYKEREKSFKGNEELSPVVLIREGVVVIPIPAGKEFKDIVQFLQEYYVEFKGMIRRNGYEIHIYPEFNAIIQYLVKYEKFPETSMTPLNYAIETYHPDIVKILLANGASMHFPDYKSSALHQAVFCGQDKTEIVEVLLQNGHKIDVINRYGRTPLLECLILECNNVAKLLMKYGANVNAKDRSTDGDGDTLLHLAIKWENYAIVESLLIHGADVNATNDYFETPLSVAVFKNSPEKVLWLLMYHGADISYKYRYENYQSLIHFAMERGGRGGLPVMKTLISFWPQSIYIQDSNEVNALEYAMKKDVSIAKFLIYNKEQ